MGRQPQVRQLGAAAIRKMATAIPPRSSHSHAERSQGRKRSIDPHQQCVQRGAAAMMKTATPMPTITSQSQTDRSQGRNLSIEPTLPVCQAEAIGPLRSSLVRRGTMSLS
jgi:hypothetical protein